MTRVQLLAGMAMKASAALLSLLLSLGSACAAAQANEGAPLDPRTVERLERMAYDG